MKTDYREKVSRRARDWRLNEIRDEFAGELAKCLRGSILKYGILRSDTGEYLIPPDRKITMPLIQRTSFYLTLLEFDRSSDMTLEAIEIIDFYENLCAELCPFGKLETDSSGPVCRFDGSEIRVPSVDPDDRNDVLCLIRSEFSRIHQMEISWAIQTLAGALRLTSPASSLQNVLRSDLLLAVARGIIEGCAGQLVLRARNLEEYSDPFLKETFLAVIPFSWIEIEKVHRLLARWLGFDRTPQSIAGIVDDLRDKCLAQGQIACDSDGRIRRKTDEHSS